VTGDPIARFLQEMNSRATALGLANTHFTNVHGDDTPDHYSTARDLLRLTVEAMKQPDFARIVAVKTTTRQTIDGKHQFPMRNTNELLFQRDGVHGVKTGTTDACGQCLVTAQWTPTGRVVAVVLGAQDRFVDTTILLDWTNSAYRWVQLGPGSTLPGLQATLNRWGVAVRSQQTVVLQAWEAPSLQYRLYLDRAQGNADMPRGEIVFSTAAREVLRLPVYPAAGSATPVPKP
jgi:D-alanyl-D-alanine carboxypeptidase (penicillin-binding protein 5/6)